MTFAVVKENGCRVFERIRDKRLALFLCASISTPHVRYAVIEC